MATHMRNLRFEIHSQAKSLIAQDPFERVEAALLMLKTLAYQAIRLWFLLCATSLFGDQVRVMQYNIHGTLGNIANN